MKASAVRATVDEDARLAQESDLEAHRDPFSERHHCPRALAHEGASSSFWQLAAWSEATCLGEVFDSSTGCELPGGSIRAAEASWVSKLRSI